VWQAFLCEELFRTLTTRKLEREQKLNEVGGAGVREGTLACKPLDFEKRPLVLMVEFIYGLTTLSQS